MTRMQSIALVVACLLGACSRSQDEPPAGDGSSGAESDGATGTGVSPSTSDAPGSDTAAADGTSAGGSDSGGVDCDSPDGCWACEPTTPVQVLNHCTDAACEPFANADRLPLLEPDGSLPPLP